VKNRPSIVRPAQAADLAEIAAIYAHAVRTSTATFDVDEPPLSFWQAKLDSQAQGDHFLVAHSRVAPDLVAHSPAAPDLVSPDRLAHSRMAGEDGKVLGYAYSTSFRPRPAYQLTRETSVYLAPDATGRGIGSQLYGELLDLLRADHVHLVVSVVAQPNAASSAMHRKLGFTEVGTLDEVGFKFGAYVSTTWFQLRLD
jgi:L-amino acid N-acyltransferase YncA